MRRMDLDERRQAIDNALAVLVLNPMVPQVLRDGIGALIEEVRELDGRLRVVEFNLHMRKFP